MKGTRVRLIVVALLPWLASCATSETLPAGSAVDLGPTYSVGEHLPSELAHADLMQALPAESAADTPVADAVVATPVETVETTVPTPAVVEAAEPAPSTSEPLAAAWSQPPRDIAALRAELQPKRIPNHGLQLGVTSQLVYAVNSHSPQPEGRALLDRLAVLLKGCDKAVIHVIGHADNARGTPQSNQAISKYRAQRVANYLISRGVMADRVRIEGRGSRERLVADSADRRKNRRVDIVIKPLRPDRPQDAWLPPPALGGPT